MTPCVQEPPRRRFTLRFKDGSSKTVCAEKIARPSSHKPYYVLTRDTETVAEYAGEDVSGWCLDDTDG